MLAHFIRLCFSDDVIITADCGKYVRSLRAVTERTVRSCKRNRVRAFHKRHKKAHSHAKNNARLCAFSVICDAC